MERLYETRELLVCCKVAGIPSQADSHGGPSMVSLLTEETGRAVFPIHRLDKPVGGVMVYAKTAEAAASLTKSIQAGEFRKEYLAVLKGVPAAPSGRLEDLLYHDPRRNKTYVVDRRRRGVREAALDYETIAQSDCLTLVRVRLLTGRTHQIRAQFSSRCLPLSGDGPYGGGSGPMGLWAVRLAFPDPASGRMLDFQKLPPDYPPWNRFPAAL